MTGGDAVLQCLRRIDQDRALRGTAGMTQPSYYGVGAAFLRRTRRRAKRGVPVVAFAGAVHNRARRLVARPARLMWDATVVPARHVATGALSIDRPTSWRSSGCRRISLYHDVRCERAGSTPAKGRWLVVPEDTSSRHGAQQLLVVAAAALTLVKDSVIALGAVAIVIVTAVDVWSAGRKRARTGESVLLALTAVGVCGVLQLAA